MFYIRGIENAFVAPLAGSPADNTTTYTGTGVDASGTDDVIALLQNVGTVSGTTPTLVGKLQESATLSGTYTDCAANQTIVTVTTSTNTQIITYQRSLSFIRYVGTIAGTSPHFVIDALLVAEKKKI